MARRAMRSPKAFVVLVFGLILGAVWAAGGLAAAAPGGKQKETISIQQGPGIKATPNPITSNGTIEVDFSAVATAGHNHNGVYSLINHNHDAAYAALLHNHNGVYASVVHNHDGVYAPFVHDHNGQYLSLSGGTLNGNLSFLNGAELIAPRMQNASSAPNNPGAGQLWFDSSAGVMKFFDGTQWRSLGGDAPLNLVSVSPPNTDISNIAFPGQKTGCAVSFTVPAGTEMVVEYGANFEVGMAMNTVYLAVAPSFDNNPPNLFTPNAARNDATGFRNFTLTNSGGNMMIYTAGPGATSVTLWALGNGGTDNHVRAPWLKVYKKTN